MFFKSLLFTYERSLFPSMIEVMIFAYNPELINGLLENLKSAYYLYQNCPALEYITINKIFYNDEKPSFSDPLHPFKMVLRDEFLIIQKTQTKTKITKVLCGPETQIGYKRINKM